MKIWICIPVFNRIEFTLKCLTTLHEQTFQNFTVVICDHGSTDGTSERINEMFPKVMVLKADSSLWWTGAINRCVEYVLQHAEVEDYLLTLNNDTELMPDYLAEFAVNVRKYPLTILASVTHDIATGKPICVGYLQNWLTAQAKAVTFEKDHLPNDERVIAVSHASGRGTLFPLAVFQQVGLYDEKHLPHYGGDYDFSHKAHRAGFPIYVCKNCRVLSHVDATGMEAVRNQFSLKSFSDYFLSIRSPANFKARWWYGINNCPKVLFPIYIMLDIVRVIGGYFKHVLFSKPLSKSS